MIWNAQELPLGRPKKMKKKVDEEEEEEEV